MLRRLSDAERGRGRWVEGGDGELAFPGELVRFSIASTSRTDGDGDSSGGWRYCEVTKARRRRRKSEQRRSGRRKSSCIFENAYSPDEPDFLNLHLIDSKSSPQLSHHSSSIVHQPEAMENSKQTISIIIEFGGGMELLFSSIRTRTITIPAFYSPASLLLPVAPTTLESLTSEGTTPVDIRYLIWYLKSFLLEDKERSDLFSQGETIRPGILILINSVDWELEDEIEYKLQEKDEIVFISTLHGG